MWATKLRFFLQKPLPIRNKCLIIEAPIAQMDRASDYESKTGVFSNPLIFGLVSR